MVNDISLAEFINDGVISQENFAKAAGIPSPLDLMSREERYQQILNNLFHATEELIEARREVARRPWKRGEIGCLDTEEKRTAFAEELFDVMLFIRATLAYAGINGNEFCKIAISKLNYNESRQDHKTNQM